jgi:hypothetical protein
MIEQSSVGLTDVVIRVGNEDKHVSFLPKLSSEQEILILINGNYANGIYEALLKRQQQTNEFDNCNIKPVSINSHGNMKFYGIVKGYEQMVVTNDQDKIGPYALRKDNDVT